MRKQIFLMFGAMLAVSSFWAQASHAQTSQEVVGTWFGSIVLNKPGGRISHDNAVLIIEEAGSDLHGSMGRTIDQMTPWTNGSVKEKTLTFHLDAAGGLDVSLTQEGEGLLGSAVGRGVTAQLSLRRAPGLMPQEKLQQEIMAADKEFYAAFSRCDVPRYASFLGKDLEFYQDHTGETGYDANLKALRDRCSEGIQLRRELDPTSLIVNAAPGFGAIEAGTQRFYSRSEDGHEHLDATARFTCVWSKSSGTWKQVRVISYDHR